MAPLLTSLFVAQFSVLIEIDKLSPKSLKSFTKMTQLRSHDVIICFRLPHPLKFRNSLFLDRVGWNLVQATISRCWFYILGLFLGADSTLKSFTKMTQLRSHDVIICFRLPHPLKFRNSLFLDRVGWNLVQATISRCWFYIWSNILH